MASKKIRDGLIDSEAVNSLHSWMAESVYCRLLLKADSAGRFDGRPGVIARQLYPLKPQIEHAEIERQLADMASAGLIIRYGYAGRPYVQLTKVRICEKNIPSKYPWEDGSKIIKPVVLNTEEGPKEFVSTSIIDPAKIPPYPEPEPATNWLRPKVTKMLDNQKFWETWDAWVDNWREKGTPLTTAQRNQHAWQLSHEQSCELAIETLKNSIETATRWPKLYKKYPDRDAEESKKVTDPNRKLTP